MSQLFSPITLRDLTLPHRAWVSPMCQYSAVDGHPTDWHLIHLGSRALGRPGLVLTEATAVSPQGRISPADAGLWSDDHVAPWRRVADAVHGQGVAVGVQLAHAGRKGSTAAPWAGGGPVAAADGGWVSEAPSAVAYDGYAEPREMTPDDLARCVGDFVAATRRAVAVGYDVVELHFAHGYLAHEFLSPLSNRRTDSWGGDLDSRMRFPLEVAEAVRAAWPAPRPLFVRISATDWADGGWTVAESVVFARECAARGVDLVDCSSGGLVPQQKISVGPGYQVPLARAVRTGAGVPVAAVGLITEPAQAEQVIVDEAADAVFLARQLLRNPQWPLLAAQQLHAAAVWPDQYARAKPR